MCVLGFKGKMDSYAEMANGKALFHKHKQEHTASSGDMLSG